MKLSIQLILFILITQIFANNNPNNEINEHSELKTFIVKTRLTKEELEELLSKRETSKGNTKPEIIENSGNSIEEVNNTDKNVKETLEKQIEEEEEKEALKPMEEFHVKEMKDSNNVKAFISKTENPKIDPFYEKKYGRIYAYLTFLFVLFLIYYFRGILFKGKENIRRSKYNNIFESDSKEYMLVKSE